MDPRCVLMALLAAGLAAADPDARRIAAIAAVAPSYVMIAGGSGVVVSADGLMLTNHHVIVDAKRIDVALAAAEERRRRDVLPVALERADIVVTSVASDEPVLDAVLMGKVMRARGNRDMFVMDLGVPRNVKPGVGALYNVFLYNLDDLSAIVEENRAARQQEIPRAEAIVAEQVSKFQMWLTSVEVIELACRLREKVRHERDEIVHARLGRVGHLSAEERARAAELLGTLIDRILQEPAGETDPHLVLHRNSGELHKLLHLVEEE